MSIYQGARLRPTRLPAATISSRRVVVSRPVETTTGDTRRPRILIGGVIVLALIGFVYLTSTLGANASSAEITRLAADRESYQNQLLTQRSIITSKLADGNIEQMAVDLGLTDLGPPLIVDLD